MSYSKSLFIFTRDLRLIDNTTLSIALKNSHSVIPIFIFNPEQISSKNKYKSNNCVQFMCECLDDLNESLLKYGSRLYFFYGSPETTINDILKKDNTIDAVYMNIDYTPYAKRREETIRTVCTKLKKDFHSHDDHLLTEDKIRNSQNNPYVKFTPFFNASQTYKIRKPLKTIKKNFIQKSYKLSNEYKKDIHKFYKQNENIISHGSRQDAKNILKNIKKFKKYSTERNFPSINTTLLSPYLKFNIISIREAYYAIKDNKKLMTQLYWRDFYMIVLKHHPKVIGHNMNGKIIKWSNSKRAFKAWCTGTTGIPMVDAGMRQMLTIGWMHNRSRMIVADFLVKILHIDWRWGERFFAQNLIDYDPSNNNGGWQWVASTGTDSQPYFRHFNPWSQSKKYDPDCKYIKKWIPELANVPNEDIHNWYGTYTTYKNNKKNNNVQYPKPIVSDIKKEMARTIEMYK